MAGHQGTPLRVMTFNIKYDDAASPVAAWAPRRAAVAATIRAAAPDVVGLQEVQSHQLADLRADLPEYEAVGVGRDDGAAGGEHVPLLVRRAAWRIAEWGTFWLSETPAVPSRFAGTTFPRTCTWAVLEPVDGAGRAGSIGVWNVHLDHESTDAQAFGLRVVLDAVRERGDVPAVVLGDLNAGPRTEPLAVVAGALHDARTRSRTAPTGPGGTFHDWVPDAVADTAGDDDSRIDHVLVSDAVGVVAYDVPVPGPGVVPSDHLPVVVDLTV
ncbi:Endonuclease/exonuclease/phosphatase [Beutenbergia cavernae DSM 12333]|uniref:Endonuclease/exonuclease/phosphatase n=1 Tax=Beutenbergia cavernae (strain ATCC BAA-8 / DSM 12333 / CCUG 43141 / JCM 11478 / NBRC 16432 / NCIMB 13614 / HKI 0122) TaxID=471853 RepID=C5BV41_BEUC1|nr:endonuclease/exonuclease/phosphatase family protein [Beutenbergia cavernae]ACQ80428.1 Endonuclease/exonuclease/phosphatase [Beutenbergia cavernae DSM 12333]